MPSRPPRKRDFAGKTIQRVDISYVNEIVFFFTDNTSITLHAQIRGIDSLYELLVRESRRFTLEKHAKLRSK